MEKIKDLNYKINIRDIKSSFNRVKIFSFLPRKQIFNITKHNKELQKMLFDNYITINDICKIIGKNGKEREYLINGNILIFEGEYFNGRKHGKGIEFYDNGKFKFKGEYLDGKRHGKGFEFYRDGTLKFKGEYLNGKAWNGVGYDNYGNIENKINNGKGNVKALYDDNNLEFEEENLNQKRSEIGKECYYRGIKYEGEYLKGKKNGKGKEYYNNNALYFEGEYLNGKRWNGKGYNINGNIDFEIKDGKGKGKVYYNDGKLKFEGEFLNGQRWNGKGKEYYYGNLLFILRIF